MTDSNTSDGFSVTTVPSVQERGPQEVASFNESFNPVQDTASEEPVSVVDTPKDKTEPEPVKAKEEQKEPEAAAEEPDPLPNFAKQFAALSRKEKAIAEQAKQIKVQEQKLQPIIKALESAKDNPMALLEAAGINFEDLLSKVLEENKEPTELELIKRDALETKQKVKEYEDAMARQKQAEYQAQIDAKKSQWSDYVGNVVSSNPEKYELICQYNQIDQVRGLIERTYQETNGQTILDVEQAAELVEEYLLEEKKQEAARIQSSKKLSTYFSVNNATPEVRKQNPQEVRNTETKPTDYASIVSEEQSANKKDLSEEESKRLAAQQIKWI